MDTLIVWGNVFRGPLELSEKVSEFQRKEPRTHLREGRQEAAKFPLGREMFVLVSSGSHTFVCIKLFIKLAFTQSLRG